MFKLYDYYRSSTCFRVRIALHFKGLSFEQIPINLVKEGGQHLTDNYRAINPQTLVPSLEDCAEKTILTQSTAIIEYLEEKFPEPTLLPRKLIQRAKARAMSQVIACDIHPLNNLRVLKYLTGPFELSEKHKLQWYHHWLTQGFNAIEKILQIEERDGPYCLGKSITIADVYLIPQVYNAQRFEFSLNDYPLIQQVNNLCMQHPAFIKAMPDNQPDAQP